MNPTNEHPNHTLEELIAASRTTNEPARLLPCPFDGAEAILYPILEPRERSPYGYYVGCSGADCLCAFGEGYDRDAMPQHAFSEPEAAIEAWNSRAALSSRDTEIREARELLSECRHAIEELVDQQAMPDVFYTRTLEAVKQFLERSSTK